MSELHSTGRGGAGNIAPDNDTTYTDGGITREGPIGDQGDGAYSAGRGGAGNINSPHVKPVKGQAGDTDVIPETAFKQPGEGPGYENYHTGVSTLPSVPSSTGMPKTDHAFRGVDKATSTVNMRRERKVWWRRLKIRCRIFSTRTSEVARCLGQQRYPCHAFHSRETLSYDLKYRMR